MQIENLEPSISKSPVQSSALQEEAAEHLSSRAGDGAAASKPIPDPNKTASALYSDINNVDLPKFQIDARAAYDDGTLDQALKQLGADTQKNHYDTSQTHTDVTLDLYQAYLNNSNGNVLFHLSVDTITDSKGQKVTSVSASGSESKCRIHRRY